MNYLNVVVLAALACGVGVAASDFPCRCQFSKEHNGWCGACDVGYVAAVPIQSRELFEAIDAHGHDVDTDSFHCDGCQNAIRTDGFCAKCKIGFVDEQAYFSKLTWLLGKGEVKPAGSLRCDECRRHIEKPGWCDHCKLGMVGHVAYRDRSRYDEAVKAYGALQKAIRTVGTCTSCAIAIAVNRTCHRCKKTYLDGELDKPAAKD
jgi:hypothetical protein